MILWLIYIILEVIIQYRLIKKGRKPIYIQLFTIRGIFSILHGILLDVENMTQYGYLLGFQICSFWIIFDLFLNKLRGKSWNYKGKDSGWLDKLEYPKYYTLKIISLIMMVYFYYSGLKYWII